MYVFLRKNIQTMCFKKEHSNYNDSPIVTGGMR